MTVQILLIERDLDGFNHTDSMKAALGIGNCVLRSYCLVVSYMYQGSYSFSGQKFKDFQGLSRTLTRNFKDFFNDNFTSKPRKMFVLTFIIWVYR